jgi:hypothetical protein
VDCSKIAETLSAFRPKWTARRGIEELYAAFQRFGLELDEFTSGRFLRIRRVKELQEAGELDEDLRRDPALAAG